MSDTRAPSSLISNRFLVGVLLAWIPVVIIVIPAFMEMFRGISDRRATGLGAVAGGLSEAFVTFGMVAFVVAEGIAVYLLIRSIGMGGTAQNVFAILTIGLSVLTFLGTGLCLWMILYVMPRLHSR